MKDPQQIKDLIISKLNMADIMLQYGISFTYDPKIAGEVQYRCPFHGADNKPSARYYNKTQSCYCWYCKKSWNVVSFIMDKEKLPYRSALMWIVNKYGIDISGISEEPKIDIEEPKFDQIEYNLSYLKRQIIDLKNSIDWSKHKVIIFAWYMIAYDHSKGLDVIESINKLDNKIKGLKNV